MLAVKRLVVLESIYYLFRIPLLTEVALTSSSMNWTSSRSSQRWTYCNKFVFLTVLIVTSSLYDFGSLFQRSWEFGMCRNPIRWPFGCTSQTTFFGSCVPQMSIIESFFYELCHSKYEWVRQFTTFKPNQIRSRK